jgi:hemoglobin/transferrin/lactoferrin receptor protein
MPDRPSPRRLVPVVLSALLLAPAFAFAQDPPAQPAASDPQPTFFDAVTVSATLNPAEVGDTPGTVTVVDAEAIDRRMLQNVADLVRFEPGVYVETVVNRVGLNGLNIRGIGGNRVMTQVDGVETTEQFDFGPFNVHQFSLDLDTLKSAEIVRSAGSSLYGSDALGGVVSFFTKDPSDYLPGNRPFHVGVKTLYDSRAADTSLNAVVAGGRPRAQASLFLSYASGSESDNPGHVATEDATRTRLNPQDRRAVQALGKLVVAPSNGQMLRGTVEIADTDIETDAVSQRTATVREIRSDDTMRRRRVSVDHSLVDRAGLSQWSWSVYVQNSETDQVVDELQTTAVTFTRHGTLAFSQDSYGATLQGRKAVGGADRAVLFTFGGGYKHHTFDMLRDRLDVNAATGVTIPTTNLILPTKYFPRSEVSETGVYAQAEMKLGRLTLVPGIRHDRFSLDADEHDAVFLATLSPPAADLDAAATSARIGAAVAVADGLTLHAQYAGGFRAPPYSAINSGFTNLAGGYTSIPNTDLDPETSDSVEFGARSTAGPVSVAVTGFWNFYDDFILQAQRGFNPATGLLEFQYQNVSEVRIRGVELQGQARLADGWTLRASYAVIRGDDVSGPADVPLQTIAPDQGVVGLQYGAASNRWGADVTVRGARRQSQARAGDGLFAPRAYAVADLTAWVALGRGLTLRAGVLNLTDATYFEWPNVRGRQGADAAIDRYSSPGRNGLLAVSYGW